ncbi:MAG: hypothetical protein QM726_12950 [Chitinophagaceae bacterium]
MTRIFFTLLLICSVCCSFTLLIGDGKKSPAASPAEIQTAAVKGFKLLQTCGVVFVNNAKCASCHHATMTSMVAATLASKGITGIDTTAQMREMAMIGTLQFGFNPNMVHQFITAKFIGPYMLLGLAAQQTPPSIYTDLAVDYAISQFLPDGSCKAEYARVPLEAGDIHLTAMSIRSVQLYAAPAKAKQVAQLVAHTRQWLENQHPHNQQEIAFQLMGLQWTGANASVINAVAQQLAGMQNKDGGWSQLSSMASDAYATGQVLYALEIAGLQEKQNNAFQNGINYLLKTQTAAGAWPMVSRSNPIQPYINSDFPPYDDNQFIAAAAANWAVLALAGALP